MKPKTFRLLITGSRDWPEADAHWILRHLDAAFGQILLAGLDFVVVHGDCPTGVDYYADFWCWQSGVKPERHPADWNKLGRSAGFRRNIDMVVSRPNMCAAFIKSNSRGATHCYQAARDAGIPTYLARYETSVK